MLNSPASVDPTGKWAKELSKYTSKRKKTDDDHAEMSRIKWFSSLAAYYTPDDGICLPANMMFACLQEGAKQIRRGKDIERGVVMDITKKIKLEYDGPKDIEKLWKKKAFVDTRVAGVNNSKIMVTRAIFSEWSVKAGIMVNEQIIDADDVKQILINAGKVGGIGTYRKFYGRFKVDFN